MIIPKGIATIPRLVEFQNSKFNAKDFNSWAFHYLTVSDEIGNTLLEFARLSERRWETPAGESITAGEMIKRIYSACNPETYLYLYLEDRNPAFPNLMRLNKVLEYHLTMGEKRPKRKQTYTLECSDDMKVFHNLKQIRELVYP